MNEDERSVVFMFAAIFFLFSIIFAIQSDNFFDIRLLKSYDHFCDKIETLMTEAGISESYTRYRDPILRYVSMSLCSHSSLLCWFSNFRFANVYTNAQQTASRVTKFSLHLTFLLPSSHCYHLLVLSRNSLFMVQESYSLRTSSILRVYLVILSFICRVGLRAPHFQASSPRSGGGSARFLFPLSSAEVSPTSSPLPTTATVCR
ncbi:hypothetical protein OESDEN_03020 [Oesophagostomum dentatum]|uniref:Uncharacterized protein n=1 Tax=Oesophagostomum dentatum TaxID=61180 RepID=A0A0B1TLN2_OESDE|nr:hypothetical protein OESDEN_03020 [Oesophagostomum dentatum]